MLEALIFDVDGTLADTERDGRRVAYNAAFAEAGLDWDWTASLYGELLALSGGKERIRYCLERWRRDFRAPADIDRGAASVSSGVVAIVIDSRRDSDESSREGMQMASISPELPSPVAPMPSLVRAATILWIVSGSMAVVAVLIAVVRIAAHMDQILWFPMPEGFFSSKLFMAQSGVAILLLLIAVVGAGFIRYGVQTLRGRISDTLSTGIFSIVIGALFLAGKTGQHHNVIGPCLFIAGILALTGRPQYQAWLRGRMDS